ncbi:MAG: AMP-binding protein [Euryarchaeota archaeon]|nr:AMP-binding protein [Euryarchaeota archaeon]
MVDYEKEMKEFTWDWPKYYDIASTVDKHAEDKTKTAIYWENDKGDERQVSYWKLKSLTNKFANILKDLGLKKKDRVMVMLPRIPETYVAQLGTVKFGGVIIPAIEMLKPSNIEYRANDCGVKAVIADTPGAEIVDKVRDKCKTVKHFILLDGDKTGWTNYDSLMNKASRHFEAEKKKIDDIFYISYTSGTTGLPKGVVHKNSWMYAFRKLNNPFWYGATDKDLIWATTSPGWAKWFWTHLGITMNTGAADFVYQGKFDIERYLELLEKYPISISCMTPTELRMAIQVPNFEDYDLSHLRSLLSAGEPLNREVIDKFEQAFGITIRDGYGQTETCCLACNYVGIPEVRAGSMGKQMPGLHIKVLNPDGNEVKPGEIGEITLKADTPAIFKEYYDKPDKTAEVIDENGQYHTQDLVKVDVDGYFWFEGRADDVILSAGYRIGPFEVEDALVKHEAVVEAAVVGTPHEVRGEIVKAFVILKKGYEPSEKLVKELQDFVKETTAPYKYPREIEFVEDLPKTISGKIKRKELKKKEYEKKDKKI